MAKQKTRIKRQFNDQMAKTLRRLNITVGSHERQVESNKPDVCVMEALSFITGQGITDAPVCVSPIISNLMICMNDNTPSNRSRNKLKKLIPEIMGTAPIYGLTDSLFVGIVHEYRDVDDPEFLTAEYERANILKQYLMERNQPRNESPYTNGELAAQEGTWDERFELVRQLSDVKRFNGEEEDND